LVSESVLEKKINFCYDFNTHISTGNTITECHYRNSFEKFAKDFARLGFDIFEIGGQQRIIYRGYKKTVDIISSNNFDF